MRRLLHIAKVKPILFFGIRRIVCVSVVFLGTLFFSHSTQAQCAKTWYKDADGDGFGDPAITQTSCASLSGFVLNKLDCNDSFFNTAVRKSVGSGGFSQGATVTTKIDMGSDGQPVVLYQNFVLPGVPTSVGVKKFDGANWVTLGTDPISTVFEMRSQNIIIGSDDAPYISFVDYDAALSSNNKVTVLKYNAALNVWEIVGIRRFSSEVLTNSRIEMKVDNNGVLYVAFLDNASNIVVMKFDTSTTTWQLVGTPGVAGNPEISLAFDDSNLPYVAFGNSSDGMASVIKFNGSSWSTVGTPGFSDNDVESPKIAINSLNVPYVAYLDYGSNEVVVQEFTGGVWTKVGSTPVDAGGGSSVTLAIDLLDVPYVAYIGSSGLTLKKLNGSNDWINTTTTFNNALQVSLTIGIDNIPYLSFSDLNDSDRANSQSIAPQVVVPDTPTVSASANTICNGENTTLSITSGNLNDGTKWVWYAGGCGLGTAVGTGTSLGVSPSATTKYYVRGEGNCSTSVGICATVTITVNTPTTITVQPNPTQTICSGTVLNLSVTATGTGLTYQWKKGGTNITGATTSSFSIASVATTDAGTYTVVVDNSGVCPPVTSNNAVVTINTPSTITAQPTATQALCVGAALNLSMTATGTGLTYQWKKGGTNITGATTSSFSIASVATTDAATYTVDVTSSGVCALPTVTSSNAVVTINTPSTITAQPTATQALCVGAALNLSVTATGTGLTYQWKKGGTNITGATNSSFSIASVATTDAATYTVDVTSSGVCALPTVTSSNAVVTINTPSTITAQPTATQALCVGAALNLSVTATGTGLTYQWKKGGTNITGATNSSFSIASVATTDAATYTVDVTSSGVCALPTVTSSNAVVTINTPSTITAQPTATQALCVGAALNLSMTATGTGLTYQWKKGGTNITGATTSSFSIASVATTDAATYTVDVTSSGVCALPTVTSSNAVVTINTPSTITAQPTATQALCVGSALNLSVTATGTGLTYQWKKGGTNITGATTSSFSIASVATTDAATYTVDVTSSGVCALPTVTSSNAVVTINTPSTITAQPTATQALCVGAALNLSVTATGTGLTYQWKKGGTNITGATTSSFSIASVATTDAATYTVDVTSSGVCALPTVTSSNAVVTINTPSTITAQPTATQALCVGAALNLSVTATGTGLTYQWKKGGTNITGATNSSFSIASVATTDAATYTVDVTSSGVCALPTVTSSNAVVTINTPSTITAQPTATQALCVGAALNLSVTATGTGLTYQWKKGGTNITGATTSSFSIASVATTDAATYTVDVTSSGVCALPTVTSSNAVVSVNTSPLVTSQPSNAMACAGANASFSVVASGTNLTYQWQEDAGSGFLDITNTVTYNGATSSVLNIVDVTSAMNGHKFKVAISNAGCTATTSNGLAALSINSIQSINTQPKDTSICAGGGASFKVLTNNGSLTYQWQINEGSGFININNGGIYSAVSSSSLFISNAAFTMNDYKFRVIVKGTCIDETSNASTLTVYALPDVSAGPDKTVELGSSVKLDGAISGDGSFEHQWIEISDPNEASLLQPTVSPTSDAEYTLSATSSKGCIATDQVVVTVIKQFVIPNAFSPNNDGVNDTWKIENLDPLMEISVHVFNRYGEPVYSTNSNPISWDGTYHGKQLPWGTYYYTIELQHSSKPITGWVVILN